MESDKPAQQTSSQQGPDSEQQPCTTSETTSVSTGPHITLGISPDDSDPEEN
jgi:hypothetical protein